MEVDEDCHRNNAEVYGEAEPGEESAFVGTVVANFRGLIREKKGSKEGERAEERQLVLRRCAISVGCYFRLDLRFRE